MAKKKKRKAPKRIYEPASPIGVRTTNKGVKVNLGLDDPKMPLYRDPPFIGWFK